MISLKDIINQIDLEKYNYWKAEGEDYLQLIRWVWYAVHNLAIEHGINPKSREYEEFWRDSLDYAIDNENYALADALQAVIYAKGMTLSDKKPRKRNESKPMG